MYLIMLFAGLPAHNSILAVTRLSAREWVLCKSLLYIDSDHTSDTCDTETELLTVHGAEQYTIESPANAAQTAEKATLVHY